jgi:hypothetical protein
MNETAAKYFLQPAPVACPFQSGAILGGRRAPTLDVMKRLHASNCL